MREKFENTLKDKLRDLEITPSQQVWEKLNASLGDIRRGESFPVAEAGSPSGTVNIRRIRRKRMSWAYVAASVAAVAIMFSVIYTFDRSVEEAQMALNESQELPTEIIDNNKKGQTPEETVEQTKVTDPRTTIVRNTVSLIPGIVADALIESEVGEFFADVEQIGGDDTLSLETGTDIQARDDLRVQEEDSAKPVLTQQIISAMTSGSKRSKRRSDNLLAASLGGNTGIAGSGITAQSRVNPFANWHPSDPVERTVDEILAKANDIKLKHRYPVTVGATVSIPLTSRLSLVTGLNYTFLKSDNDNQKSDEGYLTYDITQKLHYLGIPVSLKYDILHGNLFTLYASGGGAFEKAVSGTKTVKVVGLSGVRSVEETYTTRGRGLQMSVALNAGAEVRIAGRFGFYVEPGVAYYFKNNQPESYRTEHRLNFTARAGLRINL